MAKVVKNHIFNEIRKSLGNITFRTRKNKVIDLSHKRNPKQPNSPAQKRNKWKYGYLSEQYNKLSDDEKAYYQEKAKKLGLTAWNVYLKENWTKSGSGLIQLQNDAVLDASDPDTPYCYNTEYDMKGCGLSAYIALLKLIPPKPPDYAIFTKAILTLHVNYEDYLTSTEYYVCVSPVMTDFDECTVTYNTMPEINTYYVAKSLQVRYTTTVHQIDLSEILNALLSENKYPYGWAIYLQGSPCSNDDEVDIDGYDGWNPPNLYYEWIW